MGVVISSITAIYIGLILGFIIGFFRIKTFKPSDAKPKNKFSIVIPFRNEEENLQPLIESLLKIDYPKSLFEVLFIDDESEDASVKKIEHLLGELDNFNYKIIGNERKSQSPKKDAIETAIKHSKHEWIITTDADCIATKKWLQNFNEFIEKKKPKMICAPVTYIEENNFLNTFQILDFMSLIGSTIGGFGINKPFLCNGANMCYQKESFIEVEGFKGNNNISSGDDIFLLEKFLINFKNDVYYLKSKSAIVKTKSAKNTKNLISQHVRWASKTKSYQNSFAKIVGLIVLSMNLTILGLLFASVFITNTWNVFWQIFSVKLFVDFTLIFITLIFTNQSKKIIFLPLISILHPIFIVFVSLLSFFYKSQEWKGRKISV